MLGAAATKLLLSARADVPEQQPSELHAPSVTFAAGKLRFTAASMRIQCWR